MLELPHLLPTFYDFFLQYFDFLAFLVVLVVDSLLAFLVYQVLLFQFFGFYPDLGLQLLFLLLQFLQLFCLLGSKLIKFDALRVEALKFVHFLLQGQVYANELGKCPAFFLLLLFDKL